VWGEDAVPGLSKGEQKEEFRGGGNLSCVAGRRPAPVPKTGEGRPGTCHQKPWQRLHRRRRERMRDREDAIDVVTRFGPRRTTRRGPTPKSGRTCAFLARGGKAWKGKRYNWEHALWPRAKHLDFGKKRKKTAWRRLEETRSYGPRRPGGERCKKKQESKDRANTSRSTGRDLDPVVKEIVACSGIAQGPDMEGRAQGLGSRGNRALPEDHSSSTKSHRAEGKIRRGDLAHGGRGRPGGGGGSLRVQCGIQRDSSIPIFLWGEKKGVLGYCRLRGGGPLRRIGKSGEDYGRKPFARLKRRKRRRSGNGFGNLRGGGPPSSI